MWSGLDGSDEGSQDMVSMKNKRKLYHILPLIWGYDIVDVYVGMFS